MELHRRSRSVCLAIAAVAAALLLHGRVALAADIRLGHMEASSILFLGNSITLHGPYIGWSTEGDWGMAASEKSKDYVHLLTTQV